MMARDEVDACFSEIRRHTDTAERKLTEADIEGAYRHLCEAEYIQYRLRQDLFDRIPRENAVQPRTRRIAA